MIARLFHFFCEKFRKEGKRPPLFAEKLDDAGLWASDDGLVSFDEDGALQQLLVLHEDLDHGCRIADKIVRIQLKLFEFGILSHEIFDGVFELGDDRLKLLFAGRGFDVEDDFLLDSEFAGDRQRVGGGTSVRVVINRDFAHEKR